MNKHEGINVKCLRYVYMIDVDNRYEKSKYYGHKRILYTGQTNNLVKRVKEHVQGVNSSFLKNNFPEARKKLVYVKQLFGDEYDAIGAEWNLKRLSRDKKLSLISSDDNDLVSYIPFKVIIIKKYGIKNECEALRL